MNFIIRYKLKNSAINHLNCLKIWLMNYLNKVLCLIKCTNVTAYVEKTPKVPPNPNVLIYKEKYLNKNKKNLKI